MQLALFARTRCTHTPAAATPLVAFLERRLDMARAQTDRADTKAQLLGAALLAGATVAITVGALIRPPASITWFAWATAAAAVLVLACLGLTIRPRLGHRTDLESLPLESLAVLVADERAYAKALYDELAAVRAITYRKWMWLRWAMTGFGSVVALVIVMACIAVAA